MTRERACVHCGAPAERGTLDELGAPYCSDCADGAVYGAPCAACGRVPGPRTCAEAHGAPYSATGGRTAAEGI